VEGGKGRGRPRMAWLDNLKSWTARTSEEINRLSQNRRTWKKILLAATLNTATQQSLRSRDR